MQEQPQQLEPALGLPFSSAKDENTAQFLSKPQPTQRSFQEEEGLTNVDEERHLDDGPSLQRRRLAAACTARSRALGIASVPWAQRGLEPIPSLPWC